MITMMPAPAGAEPEPVTLQIPAMRETWPGRWHDLLRARVQDVIDALVSHEREIRAMDPGMFARMPSPSLCDRVRKRHDPTRTTLGMTVQELAR